MAEMVKIECLKVSNLNISIGNSDLHATVKGPTR